MDEKAYNLAPLSRREAVGRALNIDPMIKMNTGTIRARLLMAYGNAGTGNRPCCCSIAGIILFYAASNPA
jgi:hypothetical protein